MIEVRIPLEQVKRFDNQVLQGQHIMNRLKEAGVPVLGLLFPFGVEHGAMTAFCDPMFGDLVYRWDDVVPE